MNVLKARSCQVKVLEAHLGQFVNYHVHHLVAAAEVVMEADGHAILKARMDYGLLQSHEFGTGGLKLALRSGILH